ncbi:CHAT domain-containing protein [Microcoleus sp. FACHB-1515]|uniref:CHAT domain-containing tetratricopeptide repeat protein n=1 Tax=Cyanophyceae TaxID=3028117 RepID=UPI001689D6CD|nr:CHAT domain-containing tetratricopeptide repeat protein [Microcoleus sp. FACHB-1515]MBD2091284.1 CHAT domain-containing protein [Microcoleus sp. FACHB-1515]
MLRHNLRSLRLRKWPRRVMAVLLTLVMIFAWQMVEGRSSLAKPEGGSQPEVTSAEAQELQEADRRSRQASELQQQGQYAEATFLVQQTLEIYERILGANHPFVAISLNNLAELYREQGDYAQALPLYQQSRSILEATWGVNHPDVATALNNLALLYLDQGDYVEAEPLFKQALSILEATWGVNHPDVATALNNLAELYREQGNYAQAEPLYQRSLSILEAAWGVNHPLVGATLNNLALLYQDQGGYVEAERLYQRSLSILEATWGLDHPNIALILNGLASLYLKQGNYAQAEPLFERSLSIGEAALGVDHPFVATALNNLASLYQMQGNYAQAEPLYQQVLSIREAALGANHPLVAATFNNFAGLYQAQGNYTRALDWLRRGMEVDETNLAVTFLTGSEARKRAYIATLQGTASWAISLHLQAATTHSEAAELALTTVLRRKGRVLDAVTDSLQQLRQNLSPPDQTQLNQLQVTNTQLATLLFGGLGNYSPEQYRTQVTALQMQAEQLENQLAQRSAEFRAEVEPVTIESVQILIPADAALVELVQYNPFNPRASYFERFGTPRYAAYVLHKTGDPQAVDLGEAEPIDRQIAVLRQGLRSPTQNPQGAARRLDQLVMQPIRSLLGDKTHILISPDGQLNLIPFAALKDENDRYLLESYDFTYLTSGRDLLKLQLEAPSRSAPVLFANPDYDDPGSTQIAAIAIAQPASTRSTDQRSSDITALRFDPLPGTQTEAEAIAPLLPNLTVLTGTQATENTLKRLQSPSILHLATHGFFLEDVEFVPPNARGGDGTIAPVFTGDQFSASPNVRQSNENPLLRSGLAMAGFNPRQGGGTEDGVLTALEVTNLDLRGTELVVMSACETGLGDVINGEGVYGLRRAFVMAGAESQLMSLWKVDDHGTSQLMSLYYERLQRGENRSAALRAVQREMLQAPFYQHPYYWAGFIFSGDWRSIATF